MILGSVGMAGPARKDTVVLHCVLPGRYLPHGGKGGLFSIHELQGSG